MLITEAVKIKILRRVEHNRVLLLPGTEINVSVEEADMLIGRGIAVEIMLINDEVSDL
jgi:hypothetical protein